MYTKSVAALVASAALAQQALTFNSHRHLHGRYLARRDDFVETHVVTITKTEYVEEPPQTDPKDLPADYSQPQELQPDNNVYTPPVAQPFVAPQEPAPQEPQPNNNAYVPPAAQPHISFVAPPPATPPPSGSDKDGYGLGFPKRGIAYNNIALADPFSQACERKCGWCHNWMPLSAKVDCNFIPTLKCNKPDFTNDWTKNIDSLQNGAKVAFSFNEPDNVGECNISPEEAAASYKKFMNPYAGRIKLCAPAITNSDKPSEGTRWLDKFLEACNGGCIFDYCAAHWYGKVKDLLSLNEHIRTVSKICGGKQVWVSEYSLIADTDGFKVVVNETFMAETAKELDNNILVAGYSAFYASDGYLMAGTQLSPAGKAYVSA